MPKYLVEVTYDMNFQDGREIVQFEEKDDQAAVKHAQEMNGSWLSPIKRGVRVERLSRVIEMKSDNVPVRTISREPRKKREPSETTRRA